MAARSASTPRLATPELLFSRTPAEVSRRGTAALARAEGILKRIVGAKGRRTPANTLDPYNDLLVTVTEAQNQGNLVSNLHPKPKMREAGDKVFQAAVSFETRLNLNRDLYDAFAALNVSKGDAATRYAVFKILRDFRRAGVDRDPATRERIQKLSDEITATGQEFEKNIREDDRTIHLSGPEELEGLPEDYIASHKAGPDGRIPITTKYPDALPIFRYARRADVRRRLTEEFLNRGFPKNEAVLKRLLEKRHELARLLGHESWAAFITGDKMIGSAEAAAGFIEKITKAASDRTEEDYRILLERKRKDSPGATALDVWDVRFYSERIRAERHSVDARDLRPYFRFESVRDGIFSITGDLFGVTYRPVKVLRLWDPSVQVFDAYEGRKRLGRFYLDLHPRDGKFSHAAASLVSEGVKEERLPQALLMCNFPDPRKTSGPALMDHNDVVTFFHEFGHLLHGIFSGHGRWAKNTGFRIEWDFVEAPSQMLEEWARRAEGLQRFARHHKTGEPIPADLVERMERADAVSRGLETRRQMFYAALSLGYYNRDPAGIDLTELAREMNARYFPVPWPEGTHFQDNFGHLNDYSAIYYTYMWSLVIAKDLFSAFRSKRTIFDRATARRYRREILQPGSVRPAADLVKGFLGRAPNFQAFQTWLNQGAR